MSSPSMGDGVKVNEDVRIKTFANKASFNTKEALFAL